MIGRGRPGPDHPEVLDVMNRNRHGVIGGMGRLGRCRESSVQISVGMRAERRGGVDAGV